MQISVNKRSDIPLHQQLAEQFVFLITTGELRPAQQLPSVRALARRLKIHHNTVSKSYQDLVLRGWISRQHGRRMCVGSGPARCVRPPDSNLDELIDQSILRAGELGYSLQALREKVLERLAEEPADHVLVVEEEPALRGIICAEIYSRVGKRVEGCTVEELKRAPETAVGALIVTPHYVVPVLSPLLVLDRKCVGLMFAGAHDQIDLISGLAEPSVIGVASMSEAFLKTARSLLAPVVGARHSLQSFLVSSKGQARMEGVDLAFCDSVILPRVRCRRKVSYRLIPPRYLDDLAARLDQPGQR